jgi:hypothetical protein
MKLVRFRTYLGLFAFLFVLSAYASLYAWKAYDAASHIYFYEPILNGPHWPSTGYSLFPFPDLPDTPGFSYIPVFTPLNPTDLFIYEYLVKTQVLVVITAFLWISTALFGTYVLQNRPRLSRNGANDAETMKTATSA